MAADKEWGESWFVLDYFTNVQVAGLWAGAPWEAEGWGKEERTEPETQEPVVKGTEIQLLTSDLKLWKHPGFVLHGPLSFPGILTTGDLWAVETAPFAGHSTNGLEHENWAFGVMEQDTEAYGAQRGRESVSLPLALNPGSCQGDHTSSPLHIGVTCLASLPTFVLVLRNFSS